MANEIYNSSDMISCGGELRNAGVYTYHSEGEEERAEFTSKARRSPRERAGRDQEQPVLAPLLSASEKEGSSAERFSLGLQTSEKDREQLALAQCCKSHCREASYSWNACFQAVLWHR